MRAIVQNTYGPPDVLELKDVPKPRVGDREVLIRVHGAGVDPADWHIMRGLPYIARMVWGLVQPKEKVRGQDVAGHVEAVGDHVTQLQPGDEVFGWAQGAFAEYAHAHENHLAPKPANLTFEQAAAVPLAAVTALQALRDVGGIRPGQTVLINGASGGVGTFAVQIGKAFGAEVTGACSTRNVDMVRSLGADVVIDYTKEDFTRSGRRYDLILDNVATHSLTECRRALTPKGTLVSNSGSSGGRWIDGAGRVIKAKALSSLVGQTLRTFVTKWNSRDLMILKELIESGKIMPAIDRTFPLREAREAIAYVEAGHARGKVVISL